MKGLHHREAGEVQGLREAGVSWGLHGRQLYSLQFWHWVSRKEATGNQTTPQPGPFALASASLAALDSVPSLLSDLALLPALSSCWCPCALMPGREPQSSSRSIQPPRSPTELQCTAVSSQPALWGPQQSCVCPSRSPTCYRWDDGPPALPPLASVQRL